jgi:hypothetical protein
MSITGHLTDSMFRRYVVKRTDGQLEALRKAQEIAEARAEAERQEAEAVGRFPGA